MKINFQFPDHEFGIEIVSKYTCFIGKDSGEGKTELLSLIEDSIQDNSLKIQSPVPVSVATPATIEALLELSTRHIFIIDEFSVLRKEILSKIKDSNHLFICITRSLPLHLSYSYYGTYHVTRSNSFFHVEPANDLTVVSTVPDDIDYVVTEATTGRSEHELLDNYGVSNLKAAGGRDKIHKMITASSNSKQLILADLANIGKAYSLLRKDCKNKGVYFYDYDCFEELLNNAPVLQQFNKPKVDPSSYDSLEKYNSYILTERTKGTQFSYKHGKPLPEALLRYPKEDVLNSTVGIGLLHYIDKQDSKLHKLNIFEK